MDRFHEQGRNFAGILAVMFSFSTVKEVLQIAVLLATLIYTAQGILKRYRQSRARNPVRPDDATR